MSHVEDSPIARWTEAAWSRRSRRVYIPGRPIAGAEAEALTRFCATHSPFPGARAVVLAEAPPDIFTGWLLGVYGKVSSPSALVFVGDQRLQGAAVRTGYTAQGAVLEATALGFSTCWIGGGVRRREVVRMLGLEEHEHVYSISALGYSHEDKTIGERATAGMVRAGSRRSVESIAPGSEFWPEWVKRGLELVRVAPSATNRQPWRFALEDRSVRLFFEGRDTPVISKRLDCGIAMLHFELGARSAGIRGHWEFLEGNDVARWTPN